MERVHLETSQGKRATGIALRSRAGRSTARAHRETILAAGAVGSPHLLQLSGIGPPSHLSAHGVDVVHPLPGVGANLHDHLQIRSIYKVSGARTLNGRARSWFGKALMAAEYALFRAGPLTMPPSQLGAFAKSDAEQASANIEWHVQPLSLDRFGEPLHRFDAITPSVCNLRPTSRGEIRLASPDPETPPVIDPNYLATVEDRQVAVEGLRFTRRIMAAPALAKYQPVEWLPGGELESDEDLAQAAGDLGATIFHPVGTCRMGRDDMAVVDDRLRVHGIAGLRVIDASIMPPDHVGQHQRPHGDDRGAGLRFHTGGRCRGMTIERQLDADARKTGRQRDAALRGFTEGPVARHLIRLGSFMAMGSLSMNLSMFAEAIYLGMIGTQALAAMGVAFPVTITLFAFAGGIGTGASSVTARTMGAGDREGAALLITHSQLLALGIGVVLGVLGVAYAYDIVTLIGATGELRDLTTEYLTVYLLGFPAFMLSIVGSTLLRGDREREKSRDHHDCRVDPPDRPRSAADLRLARHAGPRDRRCRLGLRDLPHPRNGLYVVLLLRARMVRWSFAGMLDSWRRIMHVGGPAVASGLVMPAGMLIITRMLIGHGEAVVAGYNVASRVETLAHMILWSVSSSVEPFVGQNWGARFYDRVKQALSMTHRFSLVWGVVTFVLMVLVGKSIVAVIDDNPTVIEVSVWFFYIIPLSIGFMGMTQIASSVLQRARQADAVAGDLDPPRPGHHRAAGDPWQLPVRLRRHFHRNGGDQRRGRTAGLAVELARGQSHERHRCRNGVVLALGPTAMGR